MFQLRLAGRVGLRLMVAFAVLLGAVHGFRLLLLPGIISLFQPGEALTSFLRRIGILTMALLAYWAYVRFYEKRKVGELRPTLRSITVGAVSGAGLIGLAMLSLYALGVYEVTAYRGMKNELLGVAGLIVVAAMLEEIAFRGILFQALESAWGTAAALWLQSLVFALMHLENLGDRASAVDQITVVVAGTLIGAFWTLVYVHSRNLWVAAANHAAWNFSIILTGLPLSGLGDWLSLAPIASRYNGPDWLTGGMDGPESSAITLLLVGATVAALWKRTRGKFKHRQIAVASSASKHPDLPQPP
jgi:membrane protease YdiL (CAAX protease family)